MDPLWSPSILNRTTNACLVELGSGCGGWARKTERANRSQYLEWRPLQHNPPLFFSSLETSKNRKFHINTKRAIVNNQMNDTWPELRCEGCWGLPYCDYISILLPALALLSFFSTSSNFYLFICNYLIFISHPHTTSKSERFNHHFPLPSPPLPSCFLSEQMMMMMMMRENMTPDYGRPHKKKLSEAKTEPQHKHTQTNFDIQIRLSVTQTFAGTHHNGLHKAEEEWAPAMQTLLYMETQQKSATSGNSWHFVSLD